MRLAISQHPFLRPLISSEYSKPIEAKLSHTHATMSMHSLSANGPSSETSSVDESVFDHEDNKSATSASSSPSQDGDSRARDPACIVGMACRVPGASRPSELWENILEQKDVQRKMPEDRFNVDAFYHPNSSNKGTTNAKYGYFLDQDISLFGKHRSHQRSERLLGSC